MARKSAPSAAPAETMAADAAPADAPAPRPGAGLEIRAAWRRDDPRIEADAIDFWKRLDVLPPDVTPEQRVKELIAVAYQDGRLVSVATATIERFEHLRANFAVLRGATDPAFRRSGAQLALAVPSRRLLEQWAADHPEAGLAGGLAFLDPAEWGGFARIPVWPESGLTFIGYATDGRQVRVAWFDDYRVE
jgi:hypothetical protein